MSNNEQRRQESTHDLSDASHRSGDPLDLSKVFHEDHVYPRSRFTTKRLLEAGVPVHEVETFRNAVDRLPNLQLLGGVANVEKQAVLPGQWLQDAFPDAQKRATYIEENDLQDLPDDVTGFMGFYEFRKGLLRARLAKHLGVRAPVTGVLDGD